MKLISCNISHKLPDKAIYIMASDEKNDDNLLPVPLQASFPH
jgi:hypothetical protein